MIKTLIKQICPPFILNFLRFIRKDDKVELKKIISHKAFIDNPEKQDLDLYWDPEYAKLLDEWGKDNTWIEIQLILSNCKGKILDIACGTGITIKLLEKFPFLELYGFDISDVLIKKALEKNLAADRLRVADATKTNYRKNEFDYSYSIGSLEHFTLEGINEFIRESAHYTKIASFHMVPVSKSEQEEGWMTTVQSFFNNSESWWYDKFKKHYKDVHIVPSKWEDNISFGRWYICNK